MKQSIMIDIAGAVLTAEDRRLLQNPFVCGLILFSRNFETPEQLLRLTDDIRTVRQDLLIAVDQEGGRVQRFQTGFTRIKAMRTLGELYDRAPQDALAKAYEYAQTIAKELLAVGVNMTFAPVLDLDEGHNTVIGDRAFHHDPQVVITLARQFVKGLQEASMMAVGKHFPGHGFVSADSHHETPIDTRTKEAIFARDLSVFRALIATGIDAIMPAHIIYSSCDRTPAGFSRYWLSTILRDELQFKGIIFSDDLHMMGASVMGDMPQRARACFVAGCDIALVCNDRAGVLSVIREMYEHQ